MLKFASETFLAAIFHFQNTNSTESSDFTFDSYALSGKSGLGAEPHSKHVAWSSLSVYVPGSHLSHSLAASFLYVPIGHKATHSLLSLFLNSADDGHVLTHSLSPLLYSPSGHLSTQFERSKRLKHRYIS